MTEGEGKEGKGREGKGRGSEMRGPQAGRCQWPPPTGKDGPGYSLLLVSTSKYLSKLPPMCRVTRVGR